MKKTINKVLRTIFAPVILPPVVEQPAVAEPAPQLPDYSVIARERAQGDFFKAVLDDDIGTMNLVHKAYQSAHTWMSPVDPSSTSSSAPHPLIHYAALGNGDALRWFLDKGVDVETLDTAWFKCTPLYLAAQRGKVATVQILLDAGADPFARSLFKDSCDMVDEARRMGFDNEGRVAAMLLAARAKINVTRKPPLIARKPDVVKKT